MRLEHLLSREVVTLRQVNVFSYYPNIKKLTEKVERSERKEETAIVP